MKIDSIEDYFKNHENKIIEIEDFLKKDIWMKTYDGKYRLWTGQLYEDTDIPVCINDYVEIDSEDLAGQTGQLIKMDDKKYYVKYVGNDTILDIDLMYADYLKPSTEEEYKKS